MMSEGPRSPRSPKSPKGTEMKDTGYCRIIVMGAPGVGKTAITVRYLTKRFIGEYCPTLESRYKYLTSVDDTDVQFEIIDTAGQPGEVMNERYAMLGDCFIYVYSLTDRDSFQQIETFYKIVEDKRKLSNNNGNFLCGVLVGNKSDLVHSREVSQRKGHELADVIGCKFHEVSASEGTHVDSISEIFHDAYREYKKTIGSNPKERRSSSGKKFKNAIQKVMRGGAPKRRTNSYS
ncbi:unnamed protein product [Owenia fusiformis]|uniref:small monomeric GTPase n=1 Tax=Owenia fusiformis TaxID=6347 RepID=A0A8S4Q0D8_OWEFU|nr:unnamed protein product [Owenia fusiformis]